jgi:hypothetical protein
MTFIAAIGQAQALDAREAGLQATYQALNQLGSVTPSLCVFIVPHRYDPQLVISGGASLLSNTPTLGLSVSSGLTNSGAHSHSVLVAMLAGDALQAETHWFPSYSQASAETATRILQLLGYEQKPADQVIVFADGLNGNADEFLAELPGSLPILGGLSSGDLQSGNSFQIAGTQSGTGGLAAAFLRGTIKTGIGYGHGWHAVGNHFRVTRSRGFWLRTLDGRPASEKYSQLFGQPTREWAFPPLNYMSRIYPLGFEQQYTDALLVRAPLRVEADGSFRMNSGLRDGSDAYLMVGSPKDCTEAARQATRQALLALDGARPVFALVLVDVAWQLLMQANPGQEMQAVQDELGAGVKLAGGYTLGQIVPSTDSNSHPDLLNQHIVVAVFGEKEKAA